ncbi:MAG: hypothetical protein JWQ13_1880, partial [Ramlibacter sp.]|nr:hypothetical protein [Ramlibacter sp.]
ACTVRAWQSRMRAGCGALATRPAAKCAAGKPAPARLASPRSNSLRSRKRELRSDKAREHEPIARLDPRAARALVATLGRKSVRRRRIAFMRATARPHAALQGGMVAHRRRGTMLCLRSPAGTPSRHARTVVGVGQAQGHSRSLRRLRRIDLVHAIAAASMGWRPRACPENGPPRPAAAPTRRHADAGQKKKPAKAGFSVFGAQEGTRTPTKLLAST